MHPMYLCPMSPISIEVYIWAQPYRSRPVLPVWRSRRWADCRFHTWYDRRWCQFGGRKGISGCLYRWHPGPVCQPRKPATTLRWRPSALPARPYDFLMAATTCKKVGFFLLFYKRRTHKGIHRRFVDAEVWRIPGFFQKWHRTNSNQSRSIWTLGLALHHHGMGSKFWCTSVLEWVSCRRRTHPYPGR